jgi:hypothetical protein
MWEEKEDKENKDRELEGTRAEENWGENSVEPQSYAEAQSSGEAHIKGKEADMEEQGAYTAHTAVAQESPGHLPAYQEREAGVL